MGRTLRACRWAGSWRLPVIAASLAFAAICLGFLLNTPTYLGPDEPYHLDRVIAAEHGQIVLAPGSINTSKGVRGIEHNYVYSQMINGGPSQAEYTPQPMSQRPSLNALGGNLRSKASDVSNYETQHPPLYYALMGGLLRLWPGADAMAGDKLVLLVRLFNVLLLLPLPFLYFVTARRLLGDNAVARSAAFVPMLVPGLAHGAATINNDNLAILVGTLVGMLSVRVMMGDRSLRTTAIVAVTCIAAALTKATVLFLLIIVPMAYFYQWWKARSWPDLRVLAILGVGAAGSAAWWVHNYVAYGTFQPNAWGTQYALAQGAPRTSSEPVSYRDFLHVAWHLVPSRFWGALGLLEPPQLPRLMIDLLTFALFIFAVSAIIYVRDRRGPLIVVMAVPAASLLVVLVQAYLHYRHYLSIPGLQGRYVYPGIFGVMLPFAMVAVFVLRRRSNWAPLLTLAVGLLVSGWALYTSMEYTWLHRGERLRPSNWGRAFRTLEAFFPLEKPVTVALAIVMAVLILVATGVTTWSCWYGQRFEWERLRGPRAIPDAGNEIPVPTFGVQSPVDADHHVEYREVEQT